LTRLGPIESFRNLQDFTVSRRRVSDRVLIIRQRTTRIETACIGEHLTKHLGIDCFNNEVDSREPQGSSWPPAMPPFDGRSACLEHYIRKEIPTTPRRKYRDGRAYKSSTAVKRGSVLFARAHIDNMKATLILAAVAASASALSARASQKYDVYLRAGMQPHSTACRITDGYF
jgi:hypothetical protein